MGAGKGHGAGKKAWRWKKRAWRWEKGAWRGAMLKGAGGNTRHIGEYHPNVTYPFVSRVPLLLLEVKIIPCRVASLIDIQK